MDNKIQALLKSPLASDRIQGVQLLAKSGDPQAIKILSDLIQREKDAEVRQVIAKVGKNLQQQFRGNTDKHKTSVGDANKAAQLLEQAQDAMIEVDYDDAKKFARQAFALNPSLQHNEDARRLFADIFTTSPDGAIAILQGKATDGDSFDPADWLADVDGAFKPKRKNKSGEKEVTWGEALMDVGLVGLFSGGLALLLALFLGIVLSDKLITIENYFANSPDVDVTSLAADYIVGDFGELVADSISTGFSTIVAYLIDLGLIHLAAIYILNGNGSYRGILRRAAIPSIIASIVIYIFVGIYIYILISTFVTGLVTNDLNAIEMIDTINIVFGLSLIVGLIGWTVWLANAIGTNYDFGMGKGCLAMILPRLIICGLVCGCIFTFTFMLS